MIQRIVLLLVIGGLGYWYWSGPYQARVNPSYEQQLQRNDENMAGCMRAKAYQLGATGQGVGADRAREQCARQHNVYEEDGRWHSYDAVRK